VNQRMEWLEKAFSDFIGQNPGIEYKGNIYGGTFRRTSGLQELLTEADSELKFPSVAELVTVNGLYKAGNLTQRTYNCLRRHFGLALPLTLAELADKATEEDLLSIRGLGKACLLELERVFAGHGLKLKSEKQEQADEFLPAHKAAEYVGRPEDSRTIPSVYITNLFTSKKGSLRRERIRYADSAGRNIEGWGYSKADLDRILQKTHEEKGITFDLYAKERQAGLNNEQIAEKYNISGDDLMKYTEAYTNQRESRTKEDKRATDGDKRPRLTSYQYQKCRGEGMANEEIERKFRIDSAQQLGGLTAQYNKRKKKE